MFGFKNKRFVFCNFHTKTKIAKIAKVDKQFFLRNLKERGEKREQRREKREERREKSEGRKEKGEEIREKSELRRDLQACSWSNIRR